MIMTGKNQSTQGKNLFLSHLVHQNTIRTFQILKAGVRCRRAANRQFRSKALHFVKGGFIGFHQCLQTDAMAAPSNAVMIAYFSFILCYKRLINL